MKNVLIVLSGLLLALEACNTTSVEPEVDCATDGPSITAESTDTGCGTPTGTITATVSGGTAPFTYELAAVGSNDSGEFTALSAGNYTVTVTDANGCTASAIATVSSASGPTIATEATDAGCGTSNGQITVTATGGTGTLQYKLDNGTLQSSNVFTGLSTGSYSVSVVDEAGCDATETATVLSGVSLADDIMPIINASCTSNSTCHVSGSTVRSILQNNPSNVIANASGIKSRVQSGSMPKDGTLPQAQIDAIVCWVEDGAPNN